MNRQWKKAGLTAFILVILNSMWGCSSHATEIEKPRATWLWHTKEIIENGENILTFMNARNAAVLFLQVNEDIPDKHYQLFIENAKAYNIEVHALDGSPRWASDRGQEQADSFFSWLSRYQQQSSKEQQFTGVHLDIEPYLLSEWKSNYEQTVETYQRILTSAKQQAVQLHLHFGIDLPFWFDNRGYANGFGSGTLSEWVIDTADSVTLMAYRDKANGRNGIIALTENDRKYADLVNKPLWIAADTGQSSEGPKLTFFEEGETEMNNQLRIANGAIEPNSLAGFAIHSIDSWMKLKE